MSPYRKAGNRFRFYTSLPGPATVLMAILLLCGCSSMMSSATGDLADNLTRAIVNNNDPETVETGGAAYLLMIDGLVQSDPLNESLLRAATSLYSTYAGIFVEEPERAKKMTEKALEYGLRAISVRRPELKDLRTMNFEDFSKAIDESISIDVPSLYALGGAWAGWIQARKDDWDAVADIARIESIMKKVMALDETYQDGGANLYLGVLATLIPPALGGKPEEGRRYFERALELAGNKNLMIKVIYAEQYARLVFDRGLHDKLLHEVIDADPRVDGYVLANTLAQIKAQKLLKSGEDYF